MSRAFHAESQKASCALQTTNAPTWRPTFPGAQNVHVDADAVLDVPSPHLAHSLSVSVSLRLWSRYVPAGQLAQGMDVAETSSVPSYFLPAWQTLHSARPLVSAKVRFGQGLHCVLFGGGSERVVRSVDRDRDRDREEERTRELLHK